MLPAVKMEVPTEARESHEGISHPINAVEEDSITPNDDSKIESDADTKQI